MSTYTSAIGGVVSALLLLGISVSRAAPAAAITPVATAASAAAQAPNAHPAVLTADEVIKILDDTVDWYRTLGTQQQNASQPSDLLIVFANRQIADQVVGLAFDIARANAELLSSEAQDAPAAQTTPLQALSEQQARLAAQRQAVEKSLAEHSPAGKSSEIAMLDAQANLLSTMQEFANDSSTKGADASALKARIDAIAATVPTSSNAAATGTAAAASGATAAAANALKDAKEASARPGLWDLASAVLALSNKRKTINAIDEHTAELAKTFEGISAAPLRQLQAYSKRSEALAAHVQGADGAADQDLRNQFDTLAWFFKQTSAIYIPLSKEQVLLQQYRHNLKNWQQAAQRQYVEALQTLGVRAAVLVGILAAIFVLSEIWRRAVLRFAHETRRRYQLLLVRKIVVWAAVILIIGLSITTEISTFATFAGLLTAGIAVAMQSVLVSIVGYFFLIGKYGIRVGDKIQIGTVIGEVIDIGLVRMHLMELNASGPLGRTGRVVAFANLVVFQASGGLFKEIDGVPSSWHEITLKLPLAEDYTDIKADLASAVGSAMATFTNSAPLPSSVEGAPSAAISEPLSQVHLRFSDDGMLAVVRYAVQLSRAAETDEAVATAVGKVMRAVKAR